MTDESARESLILHLQRTIQLERKTQRDEIANAALPAFLPDFYHDGSYAQKAYEVADAMMKERMK